MLAYDDSHFHFKAKAIASQIEVYGDKAVFYDLYAEAIQDRPADYWLFGIKNGNATIEVLAVGWTIIYTVNAPRGTMSETVVYWDATQGYPPNSVHVDGDLITRVYDKPTFDTYTTNCWYYDTNTSLVYVKARHSSPVRIIISTAVTVTPPPIIPVEKPWIEQLAEAVTGPIVGALQALSELTISAVQQLLEAYEKGVVEPYADFQQWVMEQTPVGPPLERYVVPPVKEYAPWLLEPQSQINLLFLLHLLLVFGAIVPRLLRPE